ncbi:hypothetical protein LT493_11665 [Streptomyces tricolor]|nr:hypothetical protein [Streptomyces tricolor]
MWRFRLPVRWWHHASRGAQPCFAAGYGEEFTGAGDGRVLQDELAQRAEAGDRDGLAEERARAPDGVLGDGGQLRTMPPLHR